MSAQVQDPMSPLVDAIAARLLDRLKPILEANQSVRPRLLTVEQAAVYLGRTEYSIRHLANQGAFPVVRGDGRVQFDVQDLDKWISTNKQ